MFKRILIPTDGSKRSDHAARAGIELAQHLKAAVVGLYVYPTFQIVVSEPIYVAPELISEKAYVKAQHATGRKYLGVLERAAKKAGVPFEGRMVAHDVPAKAIVDAANDDKAMCDLVFMGSHGRGVLVQAITGSVTTKVLALCSTPVLVYRDPKATIDGESKPVQRGKG